MRDKMWTPIRVVKEFDFCFPLSVAGQSRRLAWLYAQPTSVCAAIPVSCFQETLVPLPASFAG